jgi:hypothetical protein
MENYKTILGTEQASQSLSLLSCQDIRTIFPKTAGQIRTLLPKNQDKFCPFLPQKIRTIRTNSIFFPE